MNGERTPRIGSSARRITSMALVLVLALGACSSDSQSATPSGRALSDEETSALERMHNWFLDDLTKAQKFAICDVGESFDERVDTIGQAGQQAGLNASKEVVRQFVLRECGPGTTAP